VAVPVLGVGVVDQREDLGTEVVVGALAVLEGDA
jgi:hypothetical protein